MPLAHEGRPDAAILDLDLGKGPTGIDVAHGLRRMLPQVGIVLLTSYEEPRFMGSNRMPPHGTQYVVKRRMGDLSTLDAALDTAVQAATDGSHSHEGALTGHLPRGTAPLSDTLLEIARLVAAGYTNAEIARRQSITEASVGKAVARIIRQLGIHAGPDQNQRVLLAIAYRELAGAPGDTRA